MVRSKIFWRIVLCLLVCPLLLLVVKHRKFWMFWGAALLIPFLVFLHNCVFSEAGFRGLYYLATYNENEIRVVEDNDFHFYEEGYVKSYKLNSKYYIAHRILLIPETKLVPVQYKFDGEMLIEIYDGKKLLHSFRTSKPINLLREGNEDYLGDYLVYRGKNTSHVTSVFAFELGEIPFNLIRFKWNRLKNMDIKITVLRAEKKLKEYCNIATLIIIPDLVK